jgi:hypothetical protein
MEKKTKCILNIITERDERRFLFVGDDPSCRNGQFSLEQSPFPKNLQGGSLPTDKLCDKVQVVFVHEPVPKNLR